jgi:hypothetical protein
VIHVKYTATLRLISLARHSGFPVPNPLHSWIEHQTTNKRAGDVFSAS